MNERGDPHLPAVDPASAGRVPASSLSPELLASLLVDGDDELAAWTLRHALAELTRAEVYDGLLAEAMRIVGERWANGQWSVADEHLGTQTLLRTLERVRPEAGPEARVGPLAVLAAVAGERHMVGIVCLAHLLADAGWSVANLGADVPVADLESFVRKHRPALVALSASDPERLPDLAASVAAIRAASADDGEGCRVILGGRLVHAPEAVAGLGLDHAGTSLGAAAAYAAEVLAEAIADGAGDPLED